MTTPYNRALAIERGLSLDPTREEILHAVVTLTDIAQISDDKRVYGTIVRILDDNGLAPAEHRERVGFGCLLGMWVGFVAALLGTYVGLKAIAWIASP